MPAGQGVHADDVAPPLEYVPGAHWPVHAAICSPVEAPYVPAGHRVHADELPVPARE